MKKTCGITFAVLVVWCGAARADVSLPALLSDNMVLQEGKSVAIWGKAAAGEKVTVTLADQQMSAEADSAGHWEVALKPMAAGGPHEMTVAGTNTIVVKNVLVGEVWLCSGQSNIQVTVSGSTGGAEAAAAADYPEIRFFRVGATGNDVPQSDCRGKWIVCSPLTIRSFSAVSYYFGSRLHTELKRPVGLIYSAVGATVIEAWMERNAFASDPDYKKAIERYERIMDGYHKYQQTMEQWKKDVEGAKAADREAPPEPARTGWNASSWNPGILYNGMIAPLFPYTVAGVIWYQGESNCNYAETYERMLKGMITDWRERWDLGDIPFLVVQLPNCGKVLTDPAPSRWALVREAQMRALELPNVGLAVSIDVGEAANLHPPRKREIGERLVLAAMKLAYHRDIVWSGPLFDSAKVEGSRMRLSFKYVGGGLMAKDDQPLKHFAIAGKDMKFVWATAKIEDNEVVVWSDEVEAPVAVRYNWANAPDGNLYNREGLPASPFRSDDW